MAFEFIRHVVPGTFFILFSLWWMVNIFCSYFVANLNQKLLGKKENGYRNSISFTCWDPFCCNKYSKRSYQHINGGPIEIYLKLLCLIGAIIGEYLAEKNNSSGKNVQHIIMYTFFTIHPIFELIYYYKWMEIIPKNLDYISAILAFGVEGFLFHEHLHGRHLMDVQVHSYLIISIGLCGISVLLEMIYIDDVRPALARACFTMLQGTWFYHIAFILYPPTSSYFQPWNLEDHNQMMLVTSLFAGHLALILLFEFFLGVLIYKVGFFFKKTYLFINLVTTIHFFLNFNFQRVKRSGSFHSLAVEDEDTAYELITEEKESITC